MLRINRQTDYAIRVLLFLARQKNERRYASSVIQARMLIPRTFMPRIVARLAQVGLVSTFPGREGGLALGRPAEEISLRDVVIAFEGPLCISACLDGGDRPCPFGLDCPVRRSWDQLQSLILHELEQVSMAELAAEGAIQPG